MAEFTDPTQSGESAMQTLHESMMSTKAVEYIIAVVFLMAFILFWRVIAKKQ